MAKDKRKKGCPNATCQYNEKKVLQSVDADFCPKCGTPLVYVCAKCFNEIENLGPEHRICAHCEAVADQKMDKIKDGLAKAGQAGGAAVVALGAAIGAKALPQIKKVAVNKGAKVVVDIVKQIVK